MQKSDICCFAASKLCTSFSYQKFASSVPSIRLWRDTGYGLHLGIYEDESPNNDPEHRENIWKEFTLFLSYGRIAEASSAFRDGSVTAK